MATTTFTVKDFRDQLKTCLEFGLSLLIEGVENEVDPCLDPILEKALIKKGNSYYIQVSDTLCEFDKNFKMFMTSRLGNPHFTPELSAKTTVIDFTVTMTGLEQQLLGRVLSKESKSLEESL